MRVSSSQLRNPQLLEQSRLQLVHLIPSVALTIGMGSFGAVSLSRRTSSTDWATSSVSFALWHLTTLTTKTIAIWLRSARRTGRKVISLYYFDKSIRNLRKWCGKDLTVAQTKGTRAQHRLTNFLEVSLVCLLRQEWLVRLWEREAVGTVQQKKTFSRMWIRFHHQFNRTDSIPASITLPRRDTLC